MTRDEFNAYCKSLTHSTHVVQWGGADVWKIGAKVYAIGGWDEKTQMPKDDVAIVFKVSDMAWEIYKDAGGMRPAPYMASRGMKWLQWLHDDTISGTQLLELIADSYAIVASGLTKKRQGELGLL